MIKSLNLINHYFHNLINEEKMQDLIKETPSIVSTRSAAITDVSIISTQLFKKSKMVTFKVTGSTGKTYKVVFYFKDKNDIWGEIKVYCSCPYTKWWGPNWNSKIEGYRLWTMGKDLPPDIRDPKREHKVCKHIISAFKRLYTGEMSKKK